MATQDSTTARTAPSHAPRSARARRADETKLSLMTTEFWAMVGVIAAILIASAVSDTLGDVRAWTLVAAVAIGYMISRGIAKAGTAHAGDEDSLRADDAR
jgi:hypothetical protein